MIGQLTLHSDLCYWSEYVSLYLLGYKDSLRVIFASKFLIKHLALLDSYLMPSSLPAPKVVVACYSV